MLCEQQKLPPTGASVVVLGGTGVGSFVGTGVVGRLLGLLVTGA